MSASFPRSVLPILLSAFALSACKSRDLSPPPTNAPTSAPATNSADTSLLIYPDELFPPDPPNPNISPADHAVRNRLEENLKEISAEQQPLDKVINFLADNTNIKITVNWTALHDAGIDRTTPVSVNLKEVPFRKALTTIFYEVGDGAADPALGYTVENGGITISTKEDLHSAKYQIVRVYDIRDLLPDSPTPPYTAARAQAIKSISDNIESTVDPETWRDRGGAVGSLRELNGQLIVNQTLDNQTKIFNLLEQLRNIQNAPQPKTTAPPQPQ